MTATVGLRVLSPGDPDYPQLLASLGDPPQRLHLRGKLPASADALAIVGSRRPTPYGRRMARSLAAECARAGIAVVSGLARGIDTEAHRGALAAGGLTWAVLGSGLDRDYPPENAGLAEEIVAAGGALLSELGPGAPPLPGHFPARNRIVSGLAWATVVVEGDVRSGSRITARAAAEQGREVFAVPGPADSPLSEGPHELLREGARLARRLADILEDVPMLAGDRPLPAAAGRPEGGILGSGSPDSKKIIELLGSQSVGLEALLAESGWELSRLLAVLSELELAGTVVPLDGQRYALC